MTTKLTEYERDVLVQYDRTYAEWWNYAGDDEDTHDHLYDVKSYWATLKHDIVRDVYHRVYPVRSRILDALEWLASGLCTITGHFYGCWLLNRSPLRHIINAASNLEDKAIEVAST